MMRASILLAFLISALVGAQSAKTQVPGGREGNGLAVQVRLRTKPILAGEGAWYELVISNTGKRDRVVDLNSVEFSNLLFVGRNGAALGGSVTIGDEVHRKPPEECLDDAALIVLTPLSSVTVLARITTPDSARGATIVHIGVSLRYVSDLHKCMSDNWETEVSLSAEVIHRTR